MDVFQRKPHNHMQLVVKPNKAFFCLSLSSISLTRPPARPLVPVFVSGGVLVTKQTILFSAYYWHTRFFFLEMIFWPKVGIMYLTHTYNKASIYFPDLQVLFLLDIDDVPALHVRCWLPFTGLSLFTRHVCLSSASCSTATSELPNMTEWLYPQWT